MLKFSANKMVYTKNEALGVFEMPENFRTTLETATQTLMTPWIANGSQFINPFSAVMNADGSHKPIFIRLSAACTYYRKDGDHLPEKCSFDMVNASPVKLLSF